MEIRTKPGSTVHVATPCMGLTTCNYNLLATPLYITCRGSRRKCAAWL